MFLSSFSNFYGSETVSYEHVTYNKSFKFAKINYLMFGKIKPKEVPTKVNFLEQ